MNFFFKLQIINYEKYWNLLFYLCWGWKRGCDS